MYVYKSLESFKNEILLAVENVRVCLYEAKSKVENIENIDFKVYSNKV